MKTGLLTFYHIHHYGAALQAAALKREAARLGADCEIIDYYVRQDNRLFRFPSSPSAAVADLHTALHYLPLRRRYARFEAFLGEHLRLTDRRYQTLEELREADLPYEVLLCGSDQIWNPTIFPDGQFDPVFFGAFSEARKIAYAPSFGISQIPKDMEANLKQLLAPFSHLSVREKAGQAILRDLTGREAALTLDPTLLPDGAAWEAFSRYPAGYPEGAYVLCYCISPPGVLAPYVRALARETGLPVVQLCGIRRRAVSGARCILDAGPAEFLGLFRRAAAVVTNSFHGTVFSIQFHKPFFSAVSPRELSDPENARTYGLLRRLGLSDRVAGTGETAPMQAEVDWEAVERVLAVEREQSRDYLSDALSGRNGEYLPRQTAEVREIERETDRETVRKTEREMERTPVRERERNAPPVLASRETCTGCTACFNICPHSAIAMERDREGFPRPVIDSAVCVRCGRCAAVCPALRTRRPLDAAPAAFAAWNREADIRRDSSSGGVFSALAEYVLAEGGVVFGAALDRRQRVSHTACFRPEDLGRLRGAKYVQSDLQETFRLVRWTLEKRPVLFSGTPCQVDGLYHYLGRRPDNLLTCDLVCHGVPSPGVWEDLVQSWRDDRLLDVTAVRFRDKGNEKVRAADGVMTVTYENGVSDSRPLYETEYGRAFGRSLFLRPCCHRCPYANLDRVGDFTLGDLWGLRRDEFPAEQARGISLMLVNSPRASRVFDNLPIERHPFPVERAVAGNPNLSRPTPCPPDRAEFFAAYELEPFGDVRRRYLTVPPAALRRAKKLLLPMVEAVRRRKKGRTDTVE